MKKLLSMLLVLVAMMAIFAVPANAAEIALVTDVGTIDDESFNQACWQGVEAFATANNLSYQYYQPAADSNDARMDSIVDAVDQGAKAIVLPGYLFGATVAEAQEMFPEVKFIAVDVSAGDLGTDPLENLYCAVFGEEQAGYVAGYAVVKDGYTKLGFLGGMAVPAVQRYGYGFVQGANAAAVELGTPIEINYTYGGQFFGDANITAKMDGWYAAGTEIVFACGGSMFSSIVAAASANDAFVVGVDVDQSYESETVVTSAMKGIGEAAVMSLTKNYDGTWAEIGGTLTVMGAKDDAVGLPTETWSMESFTVAEYETLMSAMKDGTLVVDATDLQSDAITTVELPNVTVIYE